MLRHLWERDRTVKAADVAKLNEKQQRRRGILEAGHYRLRCEFDQRAKLDDAEQRLESAREKDNRKRDRKHQRSAASADRRLVRMCEAEDQKAEEEGARDSRSVDCRRLVTEQYTGDGDHNCARYPRQRAVCKVIFAQRGECEHAIAHRQWNGDGGRHQAAENVIGGQRPFHRDVVRAGFQMNPEMTSIATTFRIAWKPEQRGKTVRQPESSAGETRLSPDGCGPDRESEPLLGFQQAKIVAASCR